MTELCGEPRLGEAGGESGGEATLRVFGAISTEDEKEKSEKTGSGKKSNTGFIETA
jgi:hypothetical protein